MEPKNHLGLLEDQKFPKINLKNRQLKRPKRHKRSKPLPAGMEENLGLQPLKAAKLEHQESSNRK